MKILLIWELDGSWPQSPRIPSLSLVIGWQAYVTIPLNVLLEIKELPKNAVRGPTCWKLGDRKEDRTPLSPRIYAFTLSFLLAAEAGLISKSPPLTSPNDVSPFPQHTDYRDPRYRHVLLVSLRSWMVGAPLFPKNALHHILLREKQIADIGVTMKILESVNGLC